MVLSRYSLGLLPCIMLCALGLLTMCYWHVVEVLLRLLRCCWDAVSCYFSMCCQLVAYVVLMHCWGVVVLLLRGYIGVFDALLSYVWCGREVMSMGCWGVVEVLSWWFWGVVDVLVTCSWDGWGVVEVLSTLFYFVVDVFVMRDRGVVEVFLRCYTSCLEVFPSVVDVLLTCCGGVVDVVSVRFLRLACRDLMCWRSVVELLMRCCWWGVVDEVLLVRCCWGVVHACLMFRWFVLGVVLRCCWCGVDVLLLLFCCCVLNYFRGVVGVLLRWCWCVEIAHPTRHRCYVDVLLVCCECVVDGSRVRFWCVGRTVLLTCCRCDINVLLRRCWCFVGVLLSCCWDVGMLFRCYWGIVDVVLMASRRGVDAIWCVLDVLLMC